MEIIANAVQTVNSNQDVYFTDTVVHGNNNCMIHRNNSGLITLKGNTNQCRARYKVSFGGNIAVPLGGAVQAISLAIALQGEAIASTMMIATPQVANAYWNVFGSTFIDVPKGCCITISVKNPGTQPINVQNANLIVERVA